MPSKSQRQHNFFEMIAHNPEKAKVRVTKGLKKTAKEFVAADKAEGWKMRKKQPPKGSK